MIANHLQHMQNNPTHMDKWQCISYKFKKIYNYMFDTNHNENYWSMNP